MRHYIYIFLFILVSCKEEKKQEVKAELPPFWNDIQNFKKQDSISFPPKNAILFIGSSSFTKWTDVQNYFPGHTIINRGFGGSTLLDQLRYVNDIVIPYQPKEIVIYCGENDFASSGTVTADMVVDRFIQLCEIIRKKIDVAIIYISMKPSPSRRHLFEKMKAANRRIEEFMGQQQGEPVYNKPLSAGFIDVYNKMLNAEGQPMPEIFLEDSLHMNEKGYAIWQKEIQPYLLK
jgi:lysophospholipase L1-like esterase